MKIRRSACRDKKVDETTLTISATVFPTNVKAATLQAYRLYIMQDVIVHKIFSQLAQQCFPLNLKAVTLQVHNTL